MSYDKNQPFEQRMKVNIAETKFEEYCKKQNIQFYKYGIDNHSFGNLFYNVNKIFRNTPDYIILNPKTKQSYLVEVKGCKDNLGIKLTDLKSYDFWRSLSGLYYCIYSTTFNELRMISHETLKSVVEGCEVNQYPDFNKYDEKLYYEIPFKEL